MPILNLKHDKKSSRTSRQGYISINLHTKNFSSKLYNPHGHQQLNKFK
jgi:hypothetical protein